MPLFSVIIPAYNAEKYIRRCIDSVLNQSFQHFEIIVVNNYSSDNTESILNSYNDKRFRYYNENNNGIIAHSRNYGVSKAIGEWVCFLDDDDWWFTDKLKQVSEFTDSYDLIYHSLQITGERQGLMRNYIGRSVYQNNLYKNLVIYGNICPTSSASVRKSIFDKIGGMTEDSQLVGVEDSDCWFRIAQVTDKWKFISEPLGYYYIGNNTSISMKQLEREKALLNKHINNLSKSGQTLARKTMMYKQARLLQKLGNFSDAACLYWKSFSLNRFPETLFFGVECSIVSLLKR